MRSLSLSLSLSASSVSQRATSFARRLRFIVRHGALVSVVFAVATLIAGRAAAQQYMWDGFIFPNLVAAESAMRAAPKGQDLSRYATYVGPPTEHHYYSPAFGEPLLGPLSYYDPALDPTGYCAAPTPAEALLCLGFEAVPLTCRDNSWANVPGEICDAGEGSYVALLGGYQPTCSEPRARLVFACADHSWGLQRTCSLENPRTTYLRCTTGRADLIFEAEIPYRLQINPLLQQTPSPRAAAASDRATPVTVSMTRPNALGIETQVVKLKVTVNANSAGMVDAAAEGGAPRPRGWLLRGPCAANQQRPAGKDAPDLQLSMQFLAGEARSTQNLCYVVSEYSGEYVLEGTCDTQPQCLRTEARREFNVRIDEVLADMVPLTPALDVVFIGAVPFTPSNHWLTEQNTEAFRQIVTCWNAARRPRPNRPGQFLDPLLHVNDASLEWGGKFSINGSWSQTAHISHRRGSSLDIRANNQAGAIPAAMRRAFEICAERSDPPVHWDFEQPPRVRPGQEHYHLNF
jgi:hypothetical protein